jgi:hypothetical protein
VFPLCDEACFAFVFQVSNFASAANLFLLNFYITFKGGPCCLEVGTLLLFHEVNISERNGNEMHDM